jgi:hypothetical protein
LPGELRCASAIQIAGQDTTQVDSPLSEGLCRTPTTGCVRV